MCSGAWRDIGTPDSSGFMLNNSKLSLSKEQCWSDDLCATRATWDPKVWTPLYAPEIIPPPHGIYCPQTCAGFVVPAGYAMGKNCSLVDVDECKQGGVKCGRNAYCVNQVPAFGERGYMCMCVETAFMSARIADPCVSRGVEIEFLVEHTPTNATVKNATTPSGEELLIVVIHRLVSEHVIFAGREEPVLLSSTFHALSAPSSSSIYTVTVRVAEGLMKLDAQGMYTPTIARAVASVAGYTMRSALVRVRVLMQDDSAEYTTQSHSFEVVNLTFTGLMVDIDILLAVTQHPEQHLPILYLMPQRGNGLSDSLQDRICQTKVTTPPDFACCMWELAQAYTTTRNTVWAAGWSGGDEVPNSTCPMRVHGPLTDTQLEGLMTGQFWQNSNASFAARTGAHSVHVHLEAGDLAVHAFTAKIVNGEAHYDFYIGVLFVKIDGMGHVIHTQDTRHLVRARLKLTQHVALTQDTQSILRVPIDITLFRVFNQSTNEYYDSAQVVLFVGASTAAAIHQDPVFFGSSLQWAIAIDPHGVTMAQACAKEPAHTPSVSVRGGVDCYQKVVNHLCHTLMLYCVT